VAGALVVALLAVRVGWTSLAGTLPLRAAVTTGDRQKERA
jgi:hypothetical protein